MCDPLSIGLLLSGGASLAGALTAPKPAKPPPLPANAPASTRAAGATVHVGDGQTMENDGVEITPNNQFVEKRLFGKPVGGLGRGGLAI